MRPAPNVLVRFVTGAAAGLAALLSAVAGPAAAQQLTLTLDPAPAVVAPGATLTLLATLTNDGPDAFTLLEMNGNFDAPTGLTWDYDDFFLGLETLDGGATYSANVFLNADPGAPLGDFFGTLAVSGEDPAGAPLAGSAELPVTVRVAATAVPEPGAGLLLLAGAGLSAIVPAVRRRGRRNPA
jgi:hypothetical protein